MRNNVQRVIGLGAILLQMVQDLCERFTITFKNKNALPICYLGNHSLPVIDIRIYDNKRSIICVHTQ